MKIVFDISPDMDANTCGEWMRDILNPMDFFGYSTFELDKGWSKPVAATVEEDLFPRTLFMGTDAKTDDAHMMKSHNAELGLTVWWGYDHDGCLVFHNPKEGWMIYNDDCKKTTKWKWVDADCWALNLPEDYYEEDKTW